MALLRIFFSLVAALFLPSLAVSQQSKPLEVEFTDEQGDGRNALMLRIPATMIAKVVNRDFEHRAPVNQVILGTASVGRSHCKGQVSCEVEENARGVSILCRITGSVESETCGTNGPAKIHSTACTQYVSTKRLTFDGNQFSCLPASVTSTIELNIGKIESTLPRLRGRLVVRVAKARAQESKGQVEAIIKCQTEAELCQRIDADFDIRIAELNRQMASRLVILKYVSVAQNEWKLLSMPDGVELCLGHSHQLSEFQLRRPLIGNSIEIWLPRKKNVVEQGGIAAAILGQAPPWLSAYFSETPLFLKPDEGKWQVDFTDQWIVIKLH